MGCAIRTCPSLVAQANPIGYVDRDDPPMLLVHGRADNVVPHGQSVLLYNALIAACRNARFISVQGANHGLSEVMASSRFGTQRVYTNTGCRPTTAVGSPNPTWEIVIDFLNSALGVGSSGSAGSASPGPSGGASPTPTPGGTPTCTAVATVRTEWSEGYVIQPVLITNTGSSAITGWKVTFALPADHIITGWWNGVLTARGQTVTVQNDTFNGAIAPGSSVTSVGFLVSRSDGSTAVPSGYTCTSR